MTQPAPGVAIVDDDPAVLASTVFLFTMEGYAVKSYASAGRFLADSGCDHKCLILDHHMPEMTGLELAALLRQNNRLIPILLVSGAVTPTVRARAAALGVENVLEKPPQSSDLLDFARRHVRGGSC